MKVVTRAVNQITKVATIIHYLLSYTEFIGNSAFPKEQ